jgi:uncharacterized protein YqgC (DUF456 family)
MPPWFQFASQVLLETLTLFTMLIGLAGLIVPIFPGLTVMWLATLVYAIIQATAGAMNAWEWVAFAFITLLMITGNIVDNLIIAAKMRKQFVPWRSILLAFAAGIVVSLFFTPFIGLIAAPLALFLAEWQRLKNQAEALQSTKAYLIGWGWAFGVRVAIGIAMTVTWMAWAWL